MFCLQKRIQTPKWLHLSKTHCVTYLAEVCLSLDPSGGLSSSFHYSIHMVSATKLLLFCSPSQQSLCLDLKRKQQASVLQRGHTSNSYLTQHLPCQPAVPGRAHHKKGKQRTPNSKGMLQILQTLIKHQRTRTPGLWTIATAAQLCKAV